MTATTIRVQMAQRTDTAANWTSANPILLLGELGHESDTDKLKIGDGATNWNSLTYLPIDGTWTGDTIAVAYGGTGQTTYTNGQLLIGNTTGNTLTKATLTAGTGITVTNGGGSITAVQFAAQSSHDVDARSANHQSRCLGVRGKFLTYHEKAIHLPGVL